MLIITFGIVTGIVVTTIGIITKILWDKENEKNDYEESFFFHERAFLFGMLVGGGPIAAFSAIASQLSNNPITGGIIGTTSAIILILFFVVGTTIPWMVSIGTKAIEAHRERERAFELGPCPCGCTEGEFCVQKESNSSIL